MDKTKINVAKVIEVFNEVSKIDLCSGKGKNNPRVCERQFLYGDVLDYLRDYYNELNLEEIDMTAKLIIGDYVVKNTLL